MAKETKSRGPGVPVLGSFFGLLFGPRMRPILAVAAVLVGGAYWTWSQVREKVVAEAHYQVMLGDIVVTSPPVWIKADVKGEALRDASLDAPLSILDEQLAERRKARRWIVVEPTQERLLDAARHAPRAPIGARFAVGDRAAQLFDRIGRKGPRAIERLP